jgi:4-hydroxybenzoate polyprenyltransferase
MHHNSGQIKPLDLAIGIIHLIRPKQWVKNGFVFAPLLFTGAFINLKDVLLALSATVIFCIASSATYVLNDLCDRERDRKHPKKSKTRPIASGLVSVRAAIGVLLFLYALLIYAWWIEPRVMPVIGAYLVINYAYTFWLKHKPVIDIFLIAIGFVLRVFAGAVVLDVPVSGWMFITTLCLALYLAAIKRGQELSQVGLNGREVLKKYSKSLMDRYAEMSATGALVFYSMFVMSSKPALVVTVPIVLFGLFRYWYVVDALEGGESPTDALLSDVPLLITVLAWCCSCLWALWPT